MQNRKYIITYDNGEVEVIIINEYSEIVAYQYDSIDDYINNNNN